MSRKYRLQVGENKRLRWPTLILNLSPGAAIAPQAISMTVRRLSRLKQIGFLQTQDWHHNALSKARVDKHLQLMFSLERWRKFVREGYAPKEVLGDDLPAYVQIVFVLEEPDGVQRSWFQSFQEEVQQRFPEGMFRFVLVWVGECAPESVFSVDVDLRLTVGTQGLSGGRVTPKWRAYALANVLVALATSDLADLLLEDFKKGEQANLWWAVGGAALVVERDYREQMLIRGVLKRWIKEVVGPLDENLKQDLDKEAKQWVERLLRRSISRLKEDISRLKEDLEEVEATGKSWSLASNIQGNRIHIDSVSMEPSPHPLLKRDAVPSSLPWIGRNILRQLCKGNASLSSDLVLGYQELFERSKKILTSIFFPETSEISGERDQLGEKLADLLDRRRLGLPAAHYFLERVLARIRETGIVRDGHEILRAQSTRWALYGTRDAEWLLRRQTRVCRQRRLVMPLLPSLLRFLPAGFLLYGVVFLTQPSTPEWKRWLLAAVIGVGAVLLEWGWRHYRLMREVQVFQEEAQQRLTKRVAEILAKVFHDMFSEFAKVWRPTLLFLTKAMAKLHLALEELDEGEPMRDRPSEEDGCIYWLREEKPTIRDLVEQAVEVGNLKASQDSEGRYASVASLILGQSVASTLQQLPLEVPSLNIVERVWQDLQGAAQQSVAEVLGEVKDLILTLPEHEDLLRKGRKWLWLWESASPLSFPNTGSARENAEPGEVTLMIGPDEAAFFGPEGKESPHWDANWQVAYSLVPTEISCVRGKLVVFERQNA